MLIEMWSPVFKQNGVQREPIRFHQGLNVIMGMEHADNSIGKSSSLLAIDFSFGGKSYLNSIAVKLLGNHKIYFCFQFDKKYHFYRDTAKPDEIVYCNNDYSPTKKIIPIEDFLNRLKERYELDCPELSFRMATSGFFRIAGKQNQNTDLPLQIYSRQNAADSITILIQLFNLYENIARYKTKLDTKKDQLKTFRQARKYEFISNLVGGKKQFEVNNEKIENLEYELAHLQDTHEDNINSEDIEKNHRKLQLRNAKLEVEQELRDIYRRIKLLDISMEFGLYPTEADLTELQLFFPDTNIKKIYEVEQYHQKLAKILDSAFVTEQDLLSLEKQELEEQFKAIQEEMNSIGAIPTLSNEFLEKYSELTATINALKNQNKAYLKQSTLEKERRDAEADLHRSIEDILSDIQSKLNQKMREFNDILYPEIRTSPLITLKAHNSYSFHTPDDDGTGTKFKGLVLLDLALLYLTALPAIAHDSLLLKNVGDKPTEGILTLYVQSKNINKQVFLAFDKANSYSDNVYKILTEHTVLKLSDNGNELYGIAWNKGKKTDK